MPKTAHDSPRFESDKEDCAVSPKTKLVEDKMAELNDAGFDVDRRMFVERSTNRGFTVTGVGSSMPVSSVCGLVRSDKRAQTLPAMSTRRGDHLIPQESLQKLSSQQAQLAARIRRGSLVVDSIIDDATLEDFWDKETRCHVHGLMNEGESHGDERQRRFFPADRKDLNGLCVAPPIIACQKGSKGFKDTTPNQDNFSLTFYKNGWTLACAFDGHGPFGHLVSSRTVQTVPYFLGLHEGFPDDLPSALIYAFETAHQDCLAKSLEDCWDIQASGSTAVACCWKGNKMFTANCGDSRCIVGSEKDKTLLYETADHKPDTPAEKARIEASGGEVRTQTYPDGWVNHRIFVRGENYPGLCMARTLGDESVKSCGVIATPEIGHYEIDMKKNPFILLASDGVWEFLDSSFVAKAVAKKLIADGAQVTVQKLQREARKRWKQEEGDYCDDITAVLIQLNPSVA